MTEPLPNVEIPGRGGVEAGEDGVLVAACFTGLLEFDQRVTVLVDYPFERDVAERLVSTDGTANELEEHTNIIDWTPYKEYTVWPLSYGGS